MKEVYKISPEEYETIERFLQNEMTEADAAAFKIKLQADKILQQKTEEVKLLLVGIKEVSLEEQMVKFHNSMSIKKAGRVVAFSKRWLIAASVLAIACLSLWWFAGRENKYDKLYASYFTPDPGLITAMGSSENYSFEKAMVEYKEGNYKKAIEAWSALRSAQQQSDTLNYFLGMAYLAMNKKARAKEFLTLITNDSNKSFYKDACWYLGLVFLKEGEKEKAIDLIRASNHSESNDLINAINKK